MAVIETWLAQDLKEPVQVKQLCGNFFSHNGNGNRIGVNVFDNGSPATLSGTVSGYAVLKDGTTVPCTGSLSGNQASVLLPAAAYVPGNIFVTIMLTSGTTITTLAALTGTVVMARTDTQVDPGSVVTDWTNTINAALQTVEGYTGNIIATPYASLTYPVPLGKYCIYNNLLYRCVSPIASSESWTASHWTQVKLADDVSDLKSAIDMKSFADSVFALWLTDFSSGSYVSLDSSYVGIYKSESTRALTLYFPTIKGCKIITNLSGTTYTYIIEVNGSGSGYASGEKAYNIVSDTAKIRLKLRRADNGTLSSTDIAAMTEALTIKYYPQSNIYSRTTTLENKIGNTAMGTTATTVTGAIAEHSSDISDINTVNAEQEKIIEQHSVPLEPVPDTINLYDKDNNSVVNPLDDQYTTGTLYLYGYTGDIVISTSGNRASYFTDLHVYNANNEDMGVDYGSTISASSGGTRQGRVVTIPSGAVYLTFVYRTYYSGGTLVSSVMVTKGNTLESGNYVAYSAHYKIEDFIKEDLGIIPVYVKPDGNDTNDGLSIATAFATFAKALEVSNFIYAKRAVYNQSITISGKKDVTIMPYDNDEEYDFDHPVRQKIELNGSTAILKTAMTATGTIYKGACSGGTNFQEVFIDQTLAPTISSTIFYANAFVNYPTINAKCKLKPVLSQALCEAESGTFYWDGTYIYCNIADSSFVSVSVIDSVAQLRVYDSTNVTIRDVACRFNYNGPIYVENSMGVVLDNCEGSYSAISMGIAYNNADGKMVMCFATNNGYDGFNFHGYGNTEMIDCVSIYNYDDGCSHHDACIGYIEGGEFTGNGKAGIAPAYGANVDIYNVLAVGNGHYGVGYLSTDNGHARMKGRIGGCAFVNNPVGLAVQALCSVTAIGCKYSGNTTDKQVAGTLNEY